MTNYGERISDRRLYMKLVNHNAWTNGTFLDIDSLGAGGGMGKHLIFANTQDKLSTLLSNSKLWDLIGSIGDYEYKNGLQRKQAIKEFSNEFERLSNNEKAKANTRFIQDTIESIGDVPEMTVIFGESLGEVAQ